MALTSLERFKRALRDTSDKNDALYHDALEAASTFAKRYTDRDFGEADATASDRTYEYTGSIVEIDDAVEVNSVTLDPGGLVDVDDWAARPLSPGPYTWIQLYREYRAPSPEMGFTRNLDRLVGRVERPTLVTVNAVWGFTPVPDDVQQAVIWIAGSMTEGITAGGAALASESVADVARAYMQQDASSSGGAIPARAREILDQYKRGYL